jgi:hypothetical protein
VQNKALLKFIFNLAVFGLYPVAFYFIPVLARSIGDGCNDPAGCGLDILVNSVFVWVSIVAAITLMLLLFASHAGISKQKSVSTTLLSASVWTIIYLTIYLK